MMQSVTSMEELFTCQLPMHIIYDTSGKTRDFEDLEEGESIVSIAVQQGGEYIATSIMIQ